MAAEDEALDELLGGGVVVLGAHTDLDGDGNFSRDNVHTTQDLFEHIDPLLWTELERDPVGEMAGAGHFRGLPPDHLQPVEPRALQPDVEQHEAGTARRDRLQR